MSNRLAVSASLFVISVALVYAVFGGNDSQTLSARNASRTYRYDATDFPQIWDIPPLDNVHMTLEDGVHYSLDSSLGIAEWNNTLPSGNGILHLGEDLHPFSISMFHQIRCLNIVREGLVSFRDPHKRTKPNDLVHHCMNYIRQMVLCRSDLRLESCRDPVGPQVTVSDVTHTCRDWSAVYTAAENNHQEYLSKR